MKNSNVSKEYFFKSLEITAYVQTDLYVQIQRYSGCI